MARRIVSLGSYPLVLKVGPDFNRKKVELFLIDKIDSFQSKYLYSFNRKKNMNSFNQ